MCVMKSVMITNMALLLGLAAFSQNSPTNFGWSDINRNSAMVQATWQTTIESNNRAYDLMRRTGDGFWRSATYVVSNVPDADASNSEGFYYTDGIPGKSESIHKVTRVEGTIAAPDLPARVINPAGAVIYPNPSVDGNARIVLPETAVFYDIQLIAMNGVLVREWRGVNGPNYSVSGIQPGHYLIRMVNRETKRVYVEQFIVNK
jgi:hypothetical protein